MGWKEETGRVMLTGTVGRVMPARLLMGTWTV